MTTNPRESYQTAKRWLQEHGWMVVKIHGGMYGTRSMPDMLAIRNGRHVWLEFKRPKGGKISKQQEFRIGQLTAHGAEVYVVTDLANVQEVLGAEP